MRATIIIFVLFAVVAVNCSALPKGVRSAVVGQKRSRSTEAATGTGLSCTSYTVQCVGSGQTCGETTAVFICSDGYYCNSNNICAADLSTGATCSYIYEGCNDNSICYANATNSPVCQTITYTATAGQACTYVKECAGVLACGSASGTCISLPSVGQTCNTNDGCASANFCNYKTLTCQALFSSVAGAACTETSQCQTGLFCNATTLVPGVCLAGFSSSNAPCNTTCSVKYEQCSCSETASFPTAICLAPPTATSSQATAEINVLNCIYSNNCGGNDLAQGGCSSCHSQYCTYYKQVLNIPGSFYTSSTFACAQDPQVAAFAKQYCSSASSIAAPFLLLLIALIFSM